MKKALLTLLMLFVSLGATAEVYKFQTTEFAFRTVDKRGNMGNWSDWEKCSLLIVINTNTDKVDIYSQTPQQYDIIDIGKPISDGQGGETFTISCVDEEGIRCGIRVRTQKDGELQMYVDYADACWVYNIYSK